MIFFIKSLHYVFCARVRGLLQLKIYIIKKNDTHTITHSLQTICPILNKIYYIITLNARGFDSVVTNKSMKIFLLCFPKRKIPIEFICIISNPRSTCLSGLDFYVSNMKLS